VHRCYVIWGSKKRVALPLVVASVFANAIGVIAIILVTIGGSDLRIDSNRHFNTVGGTMDTAYDIISLIVNSMLTLLTGMLPPPISFTFGANICMQCRTHLVDPSAMSRIILESGLLYPTMGIVTLIKDNTTTLDHVPFDIIPLVVLSAGIAPTLIVVRAKLGKTVESLQEQVSDIHFTSQSAPRHGEGAGTISRVTHTTGTLSMMAVEAENNRRVVDEKGTMAV
ncbi:hypothetical protein Moror_16980, partial [Moniliophthora roreri MCA 2997]